MPPRDWRFRIQDILDSIEKIQTYTRGMDYDSFHSSSITIDAVIRNLEIIGEAASHIPKDAVQKAPSLPWKEMRGMRNLLAHQYFGANIKTIWDTVQHNLPPVVPLLRALLDEEM